MKVSFPAVLVMARIDRKAGQVVAFKDNQVLANEKDQARRMGDFQALEMCGATPYTYTLAEVANADQVLEERRAELEYEAGFRESPEPERDALDRAYELGRAAFADQPATLARLERALVLARDGAVQDLGGGQYQVGEYVVNGQCGCWDYRTRAQSHDGARWCKHRLAAALTARAQKIEAEGAATPTASRVPGGNHSQPQNTTDPDFTQAQAIGAVWGDPGRCWVTLQGGRRLVLDLAHSDVEKQVKSLGWKEPVDGSGYWMSPAHQRDTALPVQYGRGRSKLFKS